MVRYLYRHAIFVFCLSLVSTTQHQTKQKYLHYLTWEEVFPLQTFNRRRALVKNACADIQQERDIFHGTSSSYRYTHTIAAKIFHIVKVVDCMVNDIHLCVSQIVICILCRRNTFVLIKSFACTIKLSFTQKRLTLGFG